MDRIGYVIVCAEHPDVTVLDPWSYFLVLPWPRQKGFELESAPLDYTLVLCRNKAIISYLKQKEFNINY